MNKFSYFSYDVERERNQVFYTIYRDSELLIKREVQWCHLNVFTALFRCGEYSEKSISYQLKKANKLALFAIRAMEIHEELSPRLMESDNE